MSTDFTYRISTTRFDEDYSPSQSSRATTNFANLARGDDRRENLRRDPISRRAVYDLSQPGPIGFVLIGIRPEGVDQDVDVR